MKLKVGKSFIYICKQIVAESRDVSAWSEIESDDMFQEGEYSGGFDADEEEFCFSVQHHETEYWFQVSLNTVHQIANGHLDSVEVRPADL